MPISICSILQMLISIAIAVGWSMNVITLICAASGHIGFVFVFRFCGVIFFPLGAIQGYF